MANKKADPDFYTLLASTAEEDKERLVMSILRQVQNGDSAALKILEKALLQRQTTSETGKPIVFMPIEIMDREGIAYEVPTPPTTPASPEPAEPNLGEVGV